MKVAEKKATTFPSPLHLQQNLHIFLAPFVCACVLDHSFTDYNKVYFMAARNAKVLYKNRSIYYIYVIFKVLKFASLQIE